MTKPNRKVVVVDDQPAVRRSVGRSLRLAGLEVREFGSAEELLAIPAEWKADCFVFDVNLTGMSGLDLYRTLRGEGVQTPVVFMTADASAISRATPEPGVVTYLLKPFDRTALLQAVDEAAGFDQVQDQASQAGPASIELNRSSQEDPQK